MFEAGTLPSGTPATDDQVRRTILDGLRTMPAFNRRLTEKNVADLLAYMHTLK